MRFFPGALPARRLLAISAIALAALTLPLAMPGPASAGREENLKDKQKHVQQQIKKAEHEAEESSRQVAAATKAFETAQAELADAKAALSDARAHLAAARAQLETARAEDARMQAELDAAQAALDQARTDLERGKAALAAQRKQVEDTVIGIYQQGDPRLLALAGYLRSETTEDLTRRMEYADTLVEDESSMFQELHAAEVLLQIRENDMEAAEARVAAQREVVAEQLRQTEALKVQADESKAAADAARQAVQEKVVRRREARAAAWRARKKDLAKLKELKQQEQRIKQQILAAAAQDNGPGYVGNDDGFLAAPVSGYVTSPFGYRTHPIYGYWGLHDGVDFGTGCGSALRASANGQVISRYYSSVYGNRLYLNVGKVNGHNITVVYNHASTYRVGVGQRVQRGQLVGYVGSTGWSTGCHLHFTVLRDGNPVDPMNYL